MPTKSFASILSALVLLAAITGTTSAQVNTAARPAYQITQLADYDSEPRLPDGRVDIDRLLSRLKELHVTTCYWLVWHAQTDWGDLKLFLPKAAKVNIQVWVYLVPPTESPPRYGNRYSEPFRLNYRRWAEAIARLSLQHTNLTGWVIDDFYANRHFFTPAVVGDLQERAKRINPRLAFFPLMYFNQISHSFVQSYRNVIDGVIVAYPRDRGDIDHAWAILQGPSQTGPSESGPRKQLKPPAQRFHMPFIVMTAGNVSTFRSRYGRPASPERVAEWLKFCLQAWRDGKCDGVVTYCLDKQPGSRVFDLARNLFYDYRQHDRHH